MKRILISSDWHIHHWENFSTKDENGIPDRLYKYLQLAKDFNRISQERNCDFRVIAGDISQASIIPPYTLNVERQVLKILNEYPTLIITGQHDLSSKSTGSAERHSLLFTTSDKLDNIEYHAEVLPVISYQGLNVGLRPWNKDELTYDSPDYKKLLDSNLDLFIGHDIVSSATNYDGHQFFGGYSQNLLFSIASLSIIGDIHKHHIYQNNEVPNKTIIIPGCPIQSTFKDDPDCGFWYVEYDEVNKEVSKFEFLRIHNIHPNYYHQFIYVNSEDEIKDENPLIHYRIKNKIKLEETTEDENSTTRKIEYNLKDLIKSVSLENKPSEVNAELLTSSIDDLMDKIKFTDEQSIKRSTIDKVVIDNFSSIKHFELDFNDFSRDLVFVGATGSGKSSVVEAIYWALTSKTTKNLPVSSIRNWYCSPDDNAEVSLYLTVDDSKYIVKRTRSLRGTTCEILKYINGEYCAFEANSVKETDDSILGLLNLKEWEVFLLSYYSAQGVELYNDLGKSTKTELLNKIVSSNEVNFLRETSGLDLKEMETELERSQSAYSTMVSTYNKNTEDINKMVGIMNSQSDIIARKKDLENQLNASKVQYDSSEMIIKKIDSDIFEKLNKLSATSSLKAQLEYRAKDLDNMERAIEEKKAELEKFKSTENPKCPTCGQEIDSSTKYDIIEKKELEIEKDEQTLEEKSKDFDRNLLSQAELEIKNLNAEVEDLNERKRKENKMQEDYKYLKYQYDEIKIDDKTEIIKYLKNTNADLLKEIEALKVKGKELKDKVLTYEYLYKKVFKRDGFLTRKLNSLALEILQAELDDMCKDYSFKGRIDENFNLNISFKGRQESSYYECSTGQKLVSNVLMACVLQNVFSKLYNLPDGILGLSVWDDIFSTTDQDYVAMIKDMLDKTVTKKYIVLTHTDNLSELFNDKILVTLDEGEGHSSNYNFSFRTNTDEFLK